MPRDLDDLARALTGDDTIVPSSGFAARVMDAVHDADADAPPFPFPWRPFAIGFVACLVWAASAISMVNQLDRGLFAEVAGAMRDAGSPALYATTAALAMLLLLGVQKTLLRR